MSTLARYIYKGRHHRRLRAAVWLTAMVAGVSAIGAWR